MRLLIDRFCSIYRRSRTWLVVSIAILCLTITINSVVAQQVDAPGNQVDGYPVVLDANELFRIRQGIPGVVSAKERAKIINARLLEVANDYAVSPESIRSEEQNNESVISAGDTVLLTIRKSDRLGNYSLQTATEKILQITRTAIIQYRQERSTKQILRGVAFALLSTIALITFLVLLQRLLSRLLIQIKVAQRADLLDFRIQNFQLIGSNVTGYLLSVIVSILRLVLILGAFYIYIPFLLSQFPATRAIGKSIFNDIFYRFDQLIAALIQYIPNLVIITIIACLTHYIIQFAKLVIAELGRDNAYPWFYPEWIEPTNRLATILLVVIGCIVATPYLPGFNSPAFQGISLFLGALFTLGSSSAVANAIAGIILIYTRAFRLGDIIRLGEITGEVIEKSLFVTRILTFKKEIITVPNASVLNSNVVNFNAISREPDSTSNNYLLLHTTITLGYDIPWRKVHEVLIHAAVETSNILAEPHPFVLQTGLNDFHVSYELNAYSDRPNLMSKTYSELHQNIQDCCNQAGIEILSPAYSSIRDGNHSTMPADYLPGDYVPPRFEIQTRPD